MNRIKGIKLLLFHTLVLLALAVSPISSVQAESDHEKSAELQVITPENVEELQLLAHTGSGVLSGRFAVQNEGSLMAAASSGGVILYDIFTGAQEDFIDLGVDAMAVAFSPDGKRLALVYGVPTGEFTRLDGSGMPYKEYLPHIHLYDMNDVHRPLKTISPPQECGASNIWKIAFSPTGNELIYERKHSIVGQEKAFCMLSLEDESVVQRLVMTEMTSSDVSSNGEYLGYIPKGNHGKVDHIEVYRSKDFEKLHDLPFDTVEWASVKFSSTGDAVALFSGSDTNPLMQIWSLPEGEPILTVQDKDLPTPAVDAGEQDQVMSFDISGDRSQVLLGTQFGNILLWNTGKNQMDKVVDTLTWESRSMNGQGLRNTEPSYVGTVQFGPGGATMIAVEYRTTVGQSGQIHIYRHPDGEEITSFYGSVVGDRDVDIEFSPDSSQLAWGGYADGHVEIHRSLDGSLVKRLDGHQQMVNQVRFSPDGTLLATAGSDGAIRLWDTKQFKTLRILSGHRDQVTRLAFSPDGTWLVSGSDDQTIRVWQTADGSLKNTLDVEDGEWRVDFLAVLPDNRSVLYLIQCYPSPLTGYLIRQAIWHIEEGEQVNIGGDSIYIQNLTQDGAIFTGYGENERVVGYLQPDGTMTGIVDHIRSPYGNGNITSLEISADRRLLVSGNGFGLHAWELANGNLNFIGLVAEDQLMASYAERYRFSPDGKLLAFADGGVVYVLGVLE